jgi:hypothetical protein
VCWKDLINVYRVLLLCSRKDMWEEHTFMYMCWTDTGILSFLSLPSIDIDSQDVLCDVVFLWQATCIIVWKPLICVNVGRYHGIWFSIKFLAAIVLPLFMLNGLSDWSTQQNHMSCRSISVVSALNYMEPSLLYVQLPASDKLLLQLHQKDTLADWICFVNICVSCHS